MQHVNGIKDQDEQVMLSQSGNNPSQKRSKLFAIKIERLRKTPFFSVVVLSVFAIVLVASLLLAQTLMNDSTATDIQAAEKSYYVAPNGNDANIGSLESPWKTIQFAMNNPIVGAGDTIFLRGGVYKEGDLVLNEGPQGEDGVYLTLRNYPNETPILRGTALKIRARDYIRIEGLTFDELPVTALGVESRFRPTKGVQIVNNTFNNTTKTPDLTFIRVSSWGGSSEPDLYLRTTNVLIEGNQLLDDNSGIPDDKADALQVGGNVDYLVIKDNYLKDTTSIGITVAGRTWKNDEKFAKDPDDIHPDQSDYVVVKGNRVENVNSNGIYLDAPGNYFVVEDNIVSGAGKNGINLGGERVTTSMNYAYGIVRRNVMFDNFINQNVGARADKDGNDATSCSQTISQDYLAVVHNVMHRNSGSRFANRLYCVDHYFLKNNSHSDFSAEEGNFFIQNPFNFVTTDAWYLDNNLYYSTNATKQYEWKASVKSSLAEYKAASGKEQNSSSTNPQYVNASANNFALSSNSPAINAGAHLTATKSAGSGINLSVLESVYFTDGMGLIPGDWIRVGSNGPVQVVDVNYDTDVLVLSKSISWNNNDPVTYDYAGTAPDIGAFEFGYTPPTPGGGGSPQPSPSNQPAPSISPSPVTSPSPNPGQIETIEILPSADAYTYSRSPQANYGAASLLRLYGASNNSQQGAFLLFDTSALESNDVVTSAKLEYTVSSVTQVQSGRGPSPVAGGQYVLWTAATGWNENSITYASAPPLLNQIQTMQIPTPGSTVSVDVKNQLSAQGLSDIAFGLVQLTNGITVDIHSRESQYPPKLILTVQGSTSGGPSPTPSPSSSPLPGGQISLEPVDDTKINESQPISTFGTQNLLHVLSSSQSVLMKFDLSSLAGRTITKATLKYTIGNSADAASTNSYKVRRILDPNWNEESVTFATAPAFGGVLAEVSGSGAGETEIVDVTQYVANNVGGFASFALTESNGTDRLAVQSKENSASPQLEISYY